MDNNKKTKSRAIIITIIILVLLIAGFFYLKSRSSTSSSNAIAKMFQSLNPSSNNKDIGTNNEKKLAEAGENINKGDKVYVTGTSTDNNPIIRRITSNSDTVFGIAINDIPNGEIGEISLSNSNGWGAFWDSISEIIDNTFGGDSNGNGLGGGSSGGDLGGGSSGGDIGGGTGGGFGGGGTGGGFGGGEDPNEIPECRDTLDNDSDTFIDRNDPQCHLGGDLTAPYIPNYDSESDSPNQNDLFECNDIIDNDNDTLIDENDPECHLGGDLNNQYIPTHTSESEIPGGGEDPMGLPDLTAGPISPTSTNSSTSIITSQVSNIGNGSTEISFSGFFTIKYIDGQNTSNSNNISNSSPIKNFLFKIWKKVSYISKAFAEEDKEVTVVIPSLQGRSNLPVNITYNFGSSGLYQVRFCADKKSADDEGTIAELQEDNNCGPWTIVTVSNSLPTGGDTGEFPSVYPECSDDIDNDEDEYIDEEDPTCHIDGDLNKAYVPEHYSERIYPTGGGTTEPNKCLLIEQNPLKFTDEEKAKLAELLRKFYLIAPTLKSDTDIVTIYSEIDQYKNLIGRIDSLTDQCYNQVDPQMNRNAWTRRGNPWFQKEFNGTMPYGGDRTYIDYNMLMGYDFGDTAPNGEKAGCYAVSGYYYGTDKYGKDCFERSPEPSCYGGAHTQIYGAGDSEYPHQNDLQAGCKWQEGVPFDSVEALLKVW